MVDRLADASVKLDEIHRFAHDYMRHLFPHGEDGICHTAFGDLTYSVAVDENSKLYLSVSLKTLPEGSQTCRAWPPEIPAEDGEFISYEENEGRFSIERKCDVKGMLEVLNKIDSTRTALMGFGWRLKKDYEEYLREREEERNPSLRLMKEAAEKTMEQIYGGK